MTKLVIQVAKLDKASFLAELRGAGAKQGKATALPAGTGPANPAPPQQPSSQQPSSQATAPGWGIISDSFGLQGNSCCADMPDQLAWVFL